MPISPIVGPQLKGNIKAPQGEQKTLQTQGWLKSRLVRLLHALKPGGLKQVQRNNQAIRNFITQSYSKDTSDVALQSIMNKYTSNKPITARQVRQITQEVAGDSQTVAGKRLKGGDSSKAARQQSDLTDKAIANALQARNVTRQFIDFEQEAHDASRSVNKNHRA